MFMLQWRGAPCSGQNQKGRHVRPVALTIIGIPACNMSAPYPRPNHLVQISCGGAK
jgi:hypothetical protein